MERKGSPFGPRVNSIGDYSRRVLPIDESADPQSVVVLSDGGAIREYDRDTWGELFAWTNLQGGGGAAAYWNGTSAIITSAGLISMTWQDKQTKDPVKISAPGLSSGIDCVGIMHHARQIVVSAPENVGLVDMETGRAIRNNKIQNDWISTTQFEPVPNHPGLAIQAVSGGQLKVWDFNSRNTTPIKNIPGLGDYPHYLQFNPTNFNEFIGCSNGQPLKVFDFGTGRAIHKIDSGSTYSKHSIYGNVVLQCRSACGDAGVTLVDEPDEEVIAFTCGGSGEETTCCLMTSTAAIVVCSNSFAEFKYTK